MNRKNNRDKTYRVTLSGLLVAVMLVLGYVESLLPTVGVPGIKLGLSNGVLIFAVFMLDIPTAYLLMSLKVGLSGLLFGGVSAMMYSFAGGLLSLTGMALLRQIRTARPLLISMAGGVLHNVGQVAMAMLILHSPRQMLYYMGILMLVGLATGAVTGLVAEMVMRHLKTVGWKAPVSAGTRKTGVMICVSLMAMLLVAYLAFSGLKQRSATVITSEPLMTMDELPIGLPSTTADP